MQLIVTIKEKDGQVKTELTVKGQDKCTKYEKMIATFYWQLIKEQIETNHSMGESDEKN